MGEGHLDYHKTYLGWDINNHSLRVFLPEEKQTSWTNDKKKALHYTRGTNTEVHATIAEIVQNYNNKFYDLRIINVCKLAGVKVYRLSSVKCFGGENGKLRTCNMFKLIQCRNKLCKMAHLLPTDIEKGYPEQLVKMMRTGVAATVTKPDGGKMG